MDGAMRERGRSAEGRVAGGGWGGAGVGSAMAWGGHSPDRIVSKGYGKTGGKRWGSCSCWGARGDESQEWLKRAFGAGVAGEAHR